MSVVVVDVKVYPFLVLSDLTFHLEEIEIGVFLVALRHLLVRSPNLEVATKRILYHQQVKILWQF